MLTDMKTLLDIAEEKGCAIPAFNVYNAETALGAIFAAEEANSCVILQMYSRLFSNFEAQFMAPSILEAARNAKVKVAFHLDHGANDEVITKALRWGCTGVMQDASTSPFEENVAILKNVVERAHAVGVSVEGELGHIGVAQGRRQHRVHQGGRGQEVCGRNRRGRAGHHGGHRSRPLQAGSRAGH